MSARHNTAWTFAITSAALFMASLDNLVVTTALPSIREQLHASLEGLQWTVNAYTLTFAVLLLTGATLGERYGRRRLFTIGLGLFTAGSAAAAMAPGIGALVVARAVQGVGAAIVIPLTLTLLSAAQFRQILVFLVDRCACILNGLTDTAGEGAGDDVTVGCCVQRTFPPVMGVFLRIQHQRHHDRGDHDRHDDGAAGAQQHFQFVNVQDPEHAAVHTSSCPAFTYRTKMSSR